MSGKIKPCKLSSMMTRRRSILSIWGVALLFCAHITLAGAGPPQQPLEKGEQSSRAHTGHNHPAPTTADTLDEKQSSKPAIPDAEVLNQDGKKIRFYSDLIKGRTVAINFIFTSCTYICPMQGTAFANLQTALGERLGKDVFLISISTDPVTDTPEKLKTWAKQYGARPGWTLVTGEKAEMDKLLLALTGDPAGKGEHSPIALIGNAAKGIWIRAYGLDEPARMIDMIKVVGS